MNERYTKKLSIQSFTKSTRNGEYSVSPLFPKTISKTRLISIIVPPSINEDCYLHFELTNGICKLHYPDQYPKVIDTQDKQTQTLLLPIISNLLYSRKYEILLKPALGQKVSTQRLDIYFVHNQQRIALYHSSFHYCKEKASSKYMKSMEAESICNLEMVYSYDTDAKCVSISKNDVFNRMIN